jgi:hypothetical protein
MLDKFIRKQPVHAHNCQVGLLYGKLFKTKGETNAT